MFTHHLLIDIFTVDGAFYQKNVCVNGGTLFQKNTALPVESSGDARASLMEAIRQAGGSGKAKLRSANDMKIEAKKKKQVRHKFIYTHMRMHTCTCTH